MQSRTPQKGEHMREVREVCGVDGTRTEAGCQRCSLRGSLDESAPDCDRNKSERTVQFCMAVGVIQLFFVSILVYAFAFATFPGNIRLLCFLQMMSERYLPELYL